MAETIEAAKRSGKIKVNSLSTIVIVTTVPPMAIAQLTDSRLLNRAREQLVEEVKANCQWEPRFLPHPQLGSIGFLLTPAIEVFLATRGLQLAPEKTLITHIGRGFDFLGQNVRKYAFGRFIGC